MALDKIEVWGTVNDQGEIRLPKDLKRQISTLFRGKYIKLWVVEDRELRSNKANKYYWGVFLKYAVAAFVSLGNAWMNPDNTAHKEMVHEILKNTLMTNGVDIVMPDGTIQKGRSTTVTDSPEFWAYIDRGRAYIYEHTGMDIPLPGQVMDD
jgi:hypothetical protein